MVSAELSCSRAKLPLVLGALSLILGLTGCVTPRATYKTTADAGARVAAARRIAIVRPDVAMNEVSAGGVVEKRDEWSDTAALNLAVVLAAETHFSRAPAKLEADAQSELTDAQALVRTIVNNHLIFLFAPDPLSSARRPLTYHVGPLDRLADACNADALLFVVANDSKGTTGRKMVEAFGFAPPMATFSSALLVARDGTVLWFNYHIAPARQIDLREISGTHAVVKELLAGLPRG